MLLENFILENPLLLLLAYHREAPAVSRIYIKKHLKRFPQMLCGALIQFFAQIAQAGYHQPEPSLFG